MQNTASPPALFIFKITRLAIPESNYNTPLLDGN